MAECSISELITKDNLDDADSNMELTQQNSFAKISVDDMLPYFNLHKTLDENKTSQGDIVLHHSRTTKEVEPLSLESDQHNITEEIENLSQKLSQHNITEETGNVSQILTQHNIMREEIEILSQELSWQNLKPETENTSNKEILSSKNNSQNLIVSLSVTNASHESHQSEVNTNTCYNLSQNNKSGESQKIIPEPCHSTSPITDPQLLPFESKTSECQIMTVTCVDYGEGSKDFIDDAEENCLVTQNILLRDEPSTYQTDNKEVNNLIENQIILYQNSPYDKYSDKVVETLQTDKDDDKNNNKDDNKNNNQDDGKDNDNKDDDKDEKHDTEKCDEKISAENTNVQTDILHIHLSQSSNYNEKEGSELDSSTIPLFKKNVVSLDYRDSADDSKESILNSETTLEQEVNEKITDCIHPEPCDELMTKDNVDNTENTTVPLQQSTVNKVSEEIVLLLNTEYFHKEKLPETNKNDQTIVLNDEQIKQLSPNLNQLSFIEDQICLSNKNDKLMVSLPVTIKDCNSNQTDIKSLSQTINSCIQSRNDQNQSSKFSQLAYSSYEVHQDLLNSEQKTSENPSQNDTDVWALYNNNANETKQMSCAANQNIIVGDKQNACESVDNEVFGKCLEQEVKLLPEDGPNFTNNKITIHDDVSQDTCSKGEGMNQTSNVSIALNADINSSYNCQIIANGTKKMSYATNQNTIVSDEQNGYESVDNEVFGKNVEEEVKFFPEDSPTSTNNKNTIHDDVSHEICSKDEDMNQMNNASFNHDQNNSSITPTIDTNSSCNYNCQINAIVSDTLKDIIIQCEQIPNDSYSNKKVKTESEFSENKIWSPKCLNVFSTEQMVSSDLQKNSLIPQTELLSKSPNTNVSQQDGLKSTSVHIIMDEKHTNKLRTSEENSNYLGSCVTSNAEELTDKPNIINSSDFDGKPHLVLENKITDEMGYQKPRLQGFIEDTEDEVKQSEMEKSHCLRDQIVPEQEENMELVSDCTFYEKDRGENYVKEVQLKKRNDFLTTRCFKWRYTPSLGLHDDIPDKVPKFEDHLRNLPILKTCSRPIRIGLSRRQRTGRLHSILGKK